MMICIQQQQRSNPLLCFNEGAQPLLKVHSLLVGSHIARAESNHAEPTYDVNFYYTQLTL